MFLKVCFLTILIVFSFARTDAQNTPGLKDIILPAPTASALGKYGEAPVSFYTGIPEITIPIYTIKTGDIELPISLSYHAGGIKLEERASNVGLGWSLISGGVITRSIRGLPDKESSSSYYQSLVPVAKRYPMENIPRDLIDGGYAIESDLPALNNISNRYFDGEPDIYHFNFGNYSGSFFLAEDGQFVVSPLQAIKIENFSDVSYSIDDVAKWILTTPDGLKYVFGVSDNNLRSGLEKNLIQSVREAITSWYLMDIISPINNTIALDYDMQQYSYYVKSGEVINELLVDHPDITTQELPHYQVKYIQNLIKEPNLKSIDFKEGKITFAVSALDEGYKIDQISVFNKENLTQPLKKFSFSYGFGTNRMTLAHFSEISSASGVSERTYTFIYDGSLPSLEPYSIAMNGQDLWGYYNGVLTNSMLPPTYTLYTPGAPVNFVGADRHTSERNMKKGILQEIIYPTGGSTEFEYEANTIYSNGYPNGIPMQPTPRSVLLSYGTGQTKTIDFTISNAENGKAQFFINNEPLLPGCPIINGISECNNAYIEGINGTNFHSPLIKEGSSHLELPNGDYRFVGTGVSIVGAPGDNMFYIKLEWNEFPELANTQPIPSNVVVGGLRIRKIISKDPYGEVLNVRKYLYNKFSDINASSGVLVNYPIPPMTTYHYFSPLPSTAPFGTPIGMNYKIYAQIQSSTQIPLSPTQGATVGYENVTELQGENGENGKTEFIFKTAKDEPDKIQPYRPFPPNISFDFRRGKLIKETIYSLKAGVFIPVKETINTYEVGKNQKIGYGVVVDLQKFGNAGTADYPRYIQDYYVAGTQMISEFGYLASKTVKDYDQDDPSKFVENTTGYTYDLTNGHYQVIKSVTTKSNSQQVEFVYKYPSDLALTGYAETARTNLISKHILTPLLQSKISTGTVQNFLTNNYYKLFPNGLVLPESIETKTGTFDAEKRILFSNYDNNGNVLEQQKANDLKQSYIWDYNNVYPIAEVVNAPVADIAYTSFEADGKGNWAYSGIPAADATAPTGKKVYDLSSGSITKAISNTTAYIISYWRPVSLSSVSIAGTMTGYPVSGRTANGWKYYEHKISAQSTATVSGSGSIDELRLYPADAQMTTYTYAPLIDMTSQCDVNNRITYYEYDGFGRLMLLRDQDKNIIRKICYNYAGQPEQCNLYESDVISGNYYAQNCPLGKIPVAYPVSVPQGMFTSYVDQQTANQLAQQYAQDQANQYGSCQIVDVPVYVENNQGDFVNIQLHNVSSGQIYEFIADPHSLGALGNVPSGTYDISLIPSSSTTWYYYSVGCSYWSDGQGPITFFGVSIVPGCSTIQMN